MVWRLCSRVQHHSGPGPRAARARPPLKPQGLLTYWFLFYNGPWELVSLLQKSDALNKYTPCPLPHSLTKKPKKKPTTTNPKSPKFSGLQRHGRRISWLICIWRCTQLWHSQHSQVLLPTPNLNPGCFQESPRKWWKIIQLSPTPGALIFDWSRMESSDWHF